MHLFFFAEIYLMFAVDSSVSSTTESAAASEASTTPISTSTAVSTSTTTLPTTTTPRSPPEPTPNVSVSTIQPKGLYVCWTDSSSDPDYYDVSFNNTFALSVNQSNCTLNELLLGGSFYVVGVRACFHGNICSNSTEGWNITYPSIPESLQLINQSINSLSIGWVQYGGFSDFVVTVDYHNYPNVTDAINITTSGNSGGNSTSVLCEIGNLLTPGGNYTVQVSAIYESLQSDVQSSSFLTKPDQPRNVSLVNQTVDTICVQWNQSGVAESFSWSVNDTNVPEDGTFLPACNGSTADCYPCSWMVTFCIRNLTIAGEIYLIEISAKVSNLTSDPETLSFQTAPPPIANVSCMSQTNTTLSVQIAVTYTGSYRSEGYSIYCSPVISDFANMTYMYMEDNATLINLSAGVMYTVEARTVSYCVNGDPAETNCSTAPNVPVEFSSTTGTSESIYLSWKTPEGYLQSYELCYANASSYGDCQIISAAPEPAKPLNLSGLSSDSNYTIQLQTLSFNLRSANETTSSWTLSEKVSEVSHSSKQTSVDVNWKAPLRNKNVFLYKLNISDVTQWLKCVNLFCKGQEPSPNLLTETCSSVVNDSEFPCKDGMMNYMFTGLKQSTDYTITIAAVNPGGSSLIERTNAVTQTNYDWIAGAVIGSLFGVLLIIALVILFLRWRQNKPPFSTKRRSSPIDSIGGEENPTYEEEPEPVAVEAFVDHVKNMSQDSNYLYACEYMLLTKLSAKNPTLAAELPDNRSKNRYTDILPYDNSRVKLIPEEDVGEGDGSDYINASYLPGFNSKCEYIAAQGPMRSTVDDFWLMIWQQKVSMVVMVTNLSERGREKCEQYWPDDNEPLCYGNITVQVKSESPQEFYTIRTLEVSSGSDKRQLYQYHFLTWPDFGIPEDIEHVLTFVRDIRNSIQGTAPLLVHCSAGVGRTGTFIVVDHLLQLIKREQWIDLFHIVLELRDHRPKMIQAESQYVFAHECIKIAIEKGMHRGSTLHIAEDEQANGDCLYANASETANDAELYANASEIHEHPV